ncbi:MAG: hypothetical protein PHX54_11015 [Lentimicrobiaceae bacterium]|nr:hypothetical protein [Lentimicrobiaceae bacterium]
MNYSVNKVSDRGKLLPGILVVVAVVILSSCAPSGFTSHEYGFFGGFIHGVIFLLALIGKLFGADVGLYAVHNTGFTYWLGFIIGFLTLGAGGAASRR